VLAADHGVWITDEPIGVVPAAPPAPVTGVGCNCAPIPGALIPRPRFEPVLSNQPLTFVAPYNTAQQPSASSLLAPGPAVAAPQISVSSNDGRTWQPAGDLLSKDAAFAGFVPEIEWDGTAHLRFGDGTYGQETDPELSFTATYRIGNGIAGMIGRDTLAHVLMVGGAGITAVRNPMAAGGGIDPETMQHIVQVAPFAFQTQLRCVTAPDYGTMAQTLAGVSQAQGTIRWTGSWYTAFVSVDPSALWTATLATKIKHGLDPLRMLGVDLVVEEAVFVGLNIGLEICVSPGFFRGDVYQAIWKLLVTGDSCTGSQGRLNAANFTFGQTVYASPIIAAAQSAPGVAAVTLVTFERMDRPTPAGVAPPTELPVGSLEIPSCDNDPNHANRGFLTLTMDGGK
jgi:predicted phage baseplate assembly protein